MQAIPYSLFQDDPVHFWVHIGLCIVGAVLALITFIVQWVSPAPYGKHEYATDKWGPKVPQRLAHMLSDSIPGVLLFLLVYFLYGNQRQAVNIVFVCLFEAHYIQRGIIHPLLMRYRNKKVAIGISLGAFGPNLLYHYINAEFVGFAVFDDSYLYDFRFILGIIIYVVGYVINRWADIKLRNLRATQSSDRDPVRTEESENEENKPHVHEYLVPHGGLYELISCPNYFGELVEWLGWTIATFSLSGLVWCLFSAATFVPRSRHNHEWYQSRFEDYPKKRKALIPFVW